MTGQNAIWPTEIRLRQQGSVLAITFDNGETFELTAEYLRVESPSAEVKGHGAGQEVTVPGKRLVSITSIVQVGNYAIRIIFDDGHSTGIYSWPYLLKLARERDEIWPAYLEKLAMQGLTRD